LRGWLTKQITKKCQRLLFIKLFHVQMKFFKLPPFNWYSEKHNLYLILDF
jgi:hypothetical protein